MGRWRVDDDDSPRSRSPVAWRRFEADAESSEADASSDSASSSESETTSEEASSGCAGVPIKTRPGFVISLDPCEADSSSSSQSSSSVRVAELNLNYMHAMQTLDGAEDDSVYASGGKSRKRIKKVLASRKASGCQCQRKPLGSH